MNETKHNHPHVCPWWLGYLLASPLRGLLQNPAAILKPHVRAEMTVLEPGPGMGFFTLELARMVGPAGRVIAPDVQPKMLAALARRAARRGLRERIDLRGAMAHTMNVEDLRGAADFVLAFAVVHELPDALNFFTECMQVLRAGGRLLLAEPRGHVTGDAWNRTLKAARQSGLRHIENIKINRSHAALLEKPAA